MVGKERKGNEEPQGDREHDSDGKGWANGLYQLFKGLQFYESLQI